MSQKYTFIKTHASAYPVVLICRVLGVTRSGYYAWLQTPPSAHARRDADLHAKIATIFTESRRTYGSPRVHAALQAAGERVSRTRVARLMREAHLVARARRARVRTTVRDATQLVGENRLNQQFHARAPNRVWLSDITYLATREGWLYLAVVLDLFARRIVGWAMQPTLEQPLTVDALHHACHRRTVEPGLLHHSDRGSQYTSGSSHAALAHEQMDVSMSRRGNCWDTAPMESFFATLNAEIGTSVFASHAAARSAVFEYIECFYNPKRRHSSLGYRSPIEVERQWEHEQTTA